MGRGGELVNAGEARESTAGRPLLSVRPANLTPVSQQLMNEKEQLKAESRRYRRALEQIRLHHQMPAGEGWEAAYNEVCTIAIDALEN